MGLQPKPGEDSGFCLDRGQSLGRSCGAAAKTWRRQWILSGQGAELREKLWGCSQNLEKTVDFVQASGRQI